MFLHRLKTDLSENLRPLAVYWLFLGAIIYRQSDWWLGEFNPDQPNDFHEVISFFSLVGLGIAAIMIVMTMFKRDDLKSPEDFCATRPIRSQCLYGTKLVFCWVMLALPIGLLVAVFGLLVGDPASGLIGGIEATAWVGFSLSLLALSCMNHAGGARSVMLVGASFVGPPVVAFMVNSPWIGLNLKHLIVNKHQFAFNILLCLVVMGGLIVALCMRQIRNKHTGQKAWWFSVAGAGCLLFSLFVPTGSMGGAEGDFITTVPTITSGERQDDYEHGNKGNAKFVSGWIKTSAVQWTNDDPNIRSFRIQELATPEFDKPWLKFQFAGFSNYGPSWNTSENAPYHVKLSYQIFDRDEQKGSSSSSSSGNSEFDMKIAALPKRKIRVVGDIEIERNHYKEFRRFPLAQEYSSRESSTCIEWQPSFAGNSRSEAALRIRQYRPILITTGNGRYHDNYRISVKHPLMRGASALESDGYAEYFSDNFLGVTREYHYDLGGRNFQQFFQWEEIEEIKKPSFEDWKKEAILIIELLDRTETLIIPIDMEVEIPDPEIIHEMLKKGEL